MAHEGPTIGGDARWSGIDAAGKGVVGVDESGSVAFVTPAGARLLGRRVDDLVDSPLQELVRDDDPDAALSRLRDAAAETGGADAPDETLTVRHWDGHDVSLRTAVETVSENGQELLVLVVHDVENYRYDGERTGDGERPSARVQEGDGPDGGRGADDDDHEADGDSAYTVEMVRGVFDHLNDALLITDPEHDVFRACNPRACDLLQYDADDLLSLPPAALFGRDGESYATFVEETFERGAGWTDDLTVETGEGTALPVEVSVAVVEFDGDPRMLWSLRDISDRLEREQELRQRVVAMESSIDGMAVVDADWTYLFVNPAHADLYGYESPDRLVGRSWFDLCDEATRRQYEREILPSLDAQGYWRGESVGQRRDGATFEQELSLATVGDGDVVGVVRDISDRKAAERLLRALNQQSRDLLRATTERDIAQRGVEAVEDIIGFDISCIRLFDPESNAFDIVAQTDRAEELIRSRPVFNLRSTYAGRAFRRGETVQKVEPDGPDTPYGDDAIETGVHVPLGEYGVLTVLTTVGQTIDERDVSLIELLASDVTMVLEHTRRERLVSDHERDLLIQRDRLRTLDQINAVIREIVQRLPRATAHREVGEVVCRCLLASELYQDAWIVESDPGTGVVATESVDGDDTWSAGESTRPDAVTTAIETGVIQVTRQYTVTGTDAECEDDPTTFEASIAVPIRHGGRVEEVLVVSTDRRDAFTESEQAEFELLGDTIEFVVRSLTTKNLLIADSVVELGIEVAAGDDVFLDLSSRFDCRCVVEDAVPLREGRLLQYATVEGAPPEEVFDRAGETDSVETRRILDQTDDTTVLELVVTESPIHDLVDLGAHVRSFSAEGGTARLVMEAPADVNVRGLLDVFRRRYDHAELVARRETGHRVAPGVQSVNAADRFLTERQRTAIRAAYAAGYYDWPRKSTAEQVAESLDITSATLHQHLRKAEEKLLHAYLGDTIYVPTRPAEGNDS
nr:bacterio-opsin activator domain-containing protein [Halomarina salina]